MAVSTTQRAKTKQKLDAKAIRDGVRKVLFNAHHPARNDETLFLTAYQILSLLKPVKRRDQLIRQHDFGGRGTGHRHAAAGVVSDAAQSLAPDVEICQLYSKKLTLKFDKKVVKPGAHCAIYRWRPVRSKLSPADKQTS